MKRRKTHAKRGRKPVGRKRPRSIKIPGEYLARKRKFNGKTFYFAMIGTKRDAEHSKTLHKEIGYVVRITKEKDGYAVWARKERKAKK